MEKILFVTGEAVPLIKTGGLADVCGALPKYIDKEKFDVRVVLPKYASITKKYGDQFTYVGNFYMDLGWRRPYVGIFYGEIDGVKFYLIDNEYYFNCEYPYSEGKWDTEKFAFFAKAVLSMLPTCNFRPDVIHCHDWQAALVPVYLNDAFQNNPMYQNIKTVITIHNLKFQGIYNVKHLMDVTGLSSYYFTDDKLEAYGDGNYLKGGIVYSDKITTVSESYAGEIQTEEYGEGLSPLLRARNNSLCGIVNGIDYKEYNPRTDKMIFKKYSAKTVEDRIKNKLALQQELGLKQDENAFMLGIVSRLTDQKGIDLIMCAAERMLERNIQLVVLGTGEYRYEEFFKNLQYRYPEKVSANICYKNELSHKIYSAADGYLMPSRFEPCGLSQIIGLRYGAVPIVRQTGGLKDTVIPYNEYTEKGDGFGFMNYNADEMLKIIFYAEEIFRNRKDSWQGIVTRGMKKNLSWKSSAKKYEALYESVIDNK